MLPCDEQSVEHDGRLISMYDNQRSPRIILSYTSAAGNQNVKARGLCFYTEMQKEM